MLVTDAKTDSQTDALAHAASEIAQLKAQIARLEKTVDGLLAQRLAGQEDTADVILIPDCNTVGNEGFQAADTDAHADTHAITDPLSDDAVVDEPDTSTVDEIDQAQSAAACTLEGEGHETEIVNDTFVWPETDTVSAHEDDDEGASESNQAIVFGDVDLDPDNETTQAPLKLIHGSLPNAVRSLICRPAPEALASRDDLTLIKGLSTDMALELAARNLNHFDRISDLDPETVAWLKSELPGAEVLHQAGWIEQAAILRTGALTRHAEAVLEHRDHQSDPALGDTAAYGEICNAPGLTEADIEPATCANVEVCENTCTPCQHARTDASMAWFMRHRPAQSEDINEADLPRSIVIAVDTPEHLARSAAPTSFLPMAAKDAGFAIQKIAHTPPSPPRDHGHARALAVSLVATGFIFFGATIFGGLKFDASVAKLLQAADLCKVTGLKTFPEACKLLSQSVL